MSMEKRTAIKTASGGYGTTVLDAYALLTKSRTSAQTCKI